MPLHRYLLTSTPRSGNTWLRLILAELLQLHQFAIHRPEDLDWNNLPERFIIQMHWPRTDSLLSVLHSKGIQPITICRHPIDVLISILHFCTYEPATDEWLNGTAGNERNLAGKSPLSQEFHDYALSERAKVLLNVSPEWVACDSNYIRYEQLATKPRSTLEHFLDGMGVSADGLSYVLESTSLGRLRRTSVNHHYWQGMPGLWRQLVSRSLAGEIAACHCAPFQQLGYDVSDAQELDDEAIRQMWNNLACSPGSSR